MEREFRQAPAYDWWQANPSETVALPVILSGIFDEEQECHWMGVRSYENEEMFARVEALYRQEYPNLFNELAAFAVTRAQTPAVFEDVEPTMAHYYRGAVMALRSLEASAPEKYFRDIPPRYSEIIAGLDMIDLETWLLSMRASTVRQTEQLRGFINRDYQWLDESEYLRTAMHIGAQYTYILVAHSRGCVIREEEIAWMTRDDESFEGWLTYRSIDY